MRFSFTLLFILAFAVGAHATLIHGTVVDADNNTVPGALIGLVNQAPKTSSNDQGKFTLKLAEGPISLTISAFGFQTLVMDLFIQGKEMNQTFVLSFQNVEMEGLDVSDDKSDFAKYLMKQAKKKYQQNRTQFDLLTFDGYQLNSLQGPKIKPKGEDAVKDSSQLALEEELKKDTTPDNRLKLWWKRVFKRYYHRKDSLEYIRTHSYAYLYTKDSIPPFRQHNLVETSSRLYYNTTGKFHEDVKGYKVYSPYRPWIEQAGFVVGIEYGPPAIYNDRDMWRDPYLVESFEGLGEFDLLEHNLDLPDVANKLIVSPFATGAHLNYKYNISQVVEMEGKNVFVVDIDPLFQKEALIYGQIWIEDLTFQIRKMQFSLTPKAMTYHQQFTFTTNYQAWDSLYVLAERKLDYRIKDGKDTLVGCTQVVFNHPRLAAPKTVKFGSEIRSMEEEAEKKNPDFWESERPFDLDSIQHEYAHFCDSVQDKYKNNRYQEIRDSLYNRITFWDVATNGIGLRYSKGGHSIFINPLLSTLQPLGVGGYRQSLRGSYQKLLDNGQTVDFMGDFNYGFANHDLRGKAGIGWTYLPRNFMRTYVEVGDYYERIASFTSFSNLFSRGNFKHIKTFTVSQRMEVITGLFAQLTLSRMDQIPIIDMKQDAWSEDVFGALNDPLDFQRYTKVTVDLMVQYRIGQKYFMRGKRKIRLPNKNPELIFQFTQGLPQVMGSMVNFTYLELQAHQKYSLPTLGYGEWAASTGAFVNKKQLRVLEYKYFRGSDQFLFTNPIQSMQLLGPTFKTPNTFISFNYFHHFNGLVLNKIPLVEKLRLMEAAGISGLYIQDQHFYQQELYVGLEQFFRIKQQRFRWGVYACTGDNSWEKANLVYKVGLSFFNTYSKRWTY